MKIDYGPEGILVVDDEPGVRRYLVRAVARESGLVAEAADADEARRLLQQGGFGLALVDIRMPRKDGLWLLDQVVAGGSDIAVVMVTGNSDVRTAVECLTRGAVNYVTKPADPEELVQVVRRSLADRRLRIENRAYRTDLERLVAERTAQLEGALQEVQAANVAIEQAYREGIYRLATAAEYRDEETGNHIRRMGLYSRFIAEGLGLHDEMLRLVLLASPMHDIGKIGIRDSVLLKPGKLTLEEFEEMKAHTIIGSRILAQSASGLMRMAEEIALSHHERFGGGGYPRGVAGGDIPLAGRIVAVADVFDALTSNRVYRPAMPVDRALEIIREESPGHFDPDVIEAFDSVLDRILAVREEFADDPGAGLRVRDAAFEPEVAKVLQELETRETGSTTP